MAEHTLETVAAEALSYFETAERSDGESFVRTRDDRPDWLEALIFEAHGDFPPDDYRYAAILDALEYLADGGDPDDGHEYADAGVDVYTTNRLEWARDLRRVGYVDQAADEGLVAPDAGIADRLGAGQYLELSEVFGSVVESLRERLEALEDEDGDDD